MSPVTKWTSLKASPGWQLLLEQKRRRKRFVKLTYQNGQDCSFHISALARPSPHFSGLLVTIGGRSVQRHAARFLWLPQSLTRHVLNFGYCKCAFSIFFRAQNTCHKVAALKRGQGKKQWIAICYDEIVRKSWSQRALATRRP